VVAIGRDITKRKQAEEELRWKTTFLEALVETSIDGILVVDDQGKKILQNQRMTDLMNIPRHIAEDKDDEIQRRWVAQATLDPAKFVERISYLNSHHNEISRDELAMKDGTVFDRYSTPLKGKDGEYYGRMWIFRDMTERRRAEEEMQWKTAFLEAQINSSLDGIVVVDGHGRPVLQNQRLIDLFKIPPQIAAQGSGESQVAWVALQVKDPDQFLQRARLLDAPSNEVLRDELEMKDGTIFDRYSAPMLGPDGKYFGRIWAHRDITDRKLSEESLRQSEEKFRQLADNITDVFWITSLDLQTMHYVSAAYERIWGRSTKNLYAHPHEWAEAVLPEDRDRVIAVFGALMRDTAEVNIEYRIARPDGTVRWIHDRGFRVHDAAGKPFRLTGIASDITERKAAEHSLKLAGDRLRLATQAGRVGVWEYDFASNRAVWDEQMYLLYGQDAGKAPPTFTEWNQFIHPDDRDQVLAQRAQALNEGGSYETHFRILRHSDGDLRYIRASTTIHRDDSGKLLRFIGLNWDVTEERQKELLLKAANDELVEANVRAGKLAVEAQAANLAKSQFLAMMSHEIRTPMNGVIGMTELLLSSDLTSEQRQFATIARNSGKALLSVINDILDFSKIEAGKMQLENIEFDLRTVLEDATEIMGVKAAEKGLPIACLIDPTIPSFLRGDPSRLRQILLNLAGNAVKFTSEGEVILRADLESQEEKVATVRFTISDTGIGIPTDQQPGLFTSFAQVDGSTTRKFGGTGLGLAISKQLVELMGGRIGVESAEGQGSTFWFTVRLEKDRVDTNQLAMATNDLAGLSVLVVEQHSATSLALSQTLRFLGCHPVQAHDAAGALEIMTRSAAEGNPFRVALLDDRFLKGEDTHLRLIKENPLLAGAALVLLTTLGRCGEPDARKAEGFAACLCKPVRFAQLRQCLALCQKDEPNDRQQTAPAFPLRSTGTRVLVADDSATNQLVAVKFLNRMGYSADTVASGAEAIQALQKARYDLVLMDCQMPEMDGFEATRRIRSEKTRVLNPLVPIVAMTACVLPGDRESCYAAGMNDYLKKPLDQGEMASVLERCLSKTRLLSDRATSSQLDSLPAGHAPHPSRNTNQTSFPPPPVFDQTALLRQLSGDRALADKVINTFITEMPVQIQRLKDAVEACDATLAGRVAHRIKGASGTVGARALRQLADAMELAGKSVKLETLRNLLPQTDMEFARFRKALRSEKDTASPAAKVE
jgi:PAS domain S-box-containing protein